MNKRSIAGAAAIMVATLAVGGCAAGTGSSEEPAGDPVAGGTLTWGIPTEPSAGGLDPMAASAVAAEVINAVAYDTLLAKDDDGAVIPALATSWEQPDELTWVFELRDDVTFADGSEFSADDVVYSFEQHMQATTSNSTYLANVASVESTADNEVTFHFSEPDGTFLDAVSARQTFFIVSEEGYGAASADERQTQTYGTGAFQVTDWAKGVSVTLDKNEDYWGETDPYIDEIVFELIPDESTRLAALQQGSIQAAYFMDGSLADQAVQGGFTLGEASYRQNLAIYINPETGPLADVDVRRAFSLALDRQALVDTAMLGYGAVSFAPPAGEPDALDAAGLPYYERDVDAAKKLLADAGQPNPEITLSYMGDVAQAHHPVYEMMQQQLAEAGITLNLDAKPLSEIAPVFTTGETWTDLVAIPGSPRASSLFYYDPLMVEGGVYNHWADNPDADRARELFQQAKSAADPEEYADLVEQLTEESAEQVLEFVPLAVPVYFEVWDSAKLQGYESDAYYSRYRLDESWLSQ